MITFLGEQGVQGLYILRIALQETVRLHFGRFAGGQRFALPAGDYLYIGSAMGQRGATTLAGRLLRHATRANGTAHPIREPLFAQLLADEFAPKLPTAKRCHWHIDYLIEEPAATIVAIIALRTAITLEPIVAHQLMAQPATAIPIPGLGASDDPGATHFLQIVPLANCSVEEWWQGLPSWLQVLTTQL